MEWPEASQEISSSLTPHQPEETEIAVSPKETRSHILLITASSETYYQISSSLGLEMKLHSAMSTNEGLSMLTADCPDLILCDSDIQLNELLDALKHSEYCDTPLILISSTEDRKKYSQLLSKGVTDFIMKPIEPSELKVRIEGYLQTHRAKMLLQKELHHRGETIEGLARELADKTHELDRLNHLKDEFMAVLSHELRNPINVIAGFADIIRTEDGQTEIAKEAAEAIHRNAQVQSKLVTDLLDISKGIAGKLALECKPMQVYQILKELLPSVKHEAEKKNVQIFVHRETNHGWINGDSARISQVVWNLLSNSIKFTPSGGRIEVYLSRTERWIELVIQDNGVGINPAFLPHLFERFHQQDPSITRNYGGLGLGLAIVHHIVDLHGGTVEAKSDGIGHGATFRVRFPALTN